MAFTVLSGMTTDFRLPAKWIPLYLRLIVCTPSSAGLKLIWHRLSSRSRISHVSTFPLGDVRVASMSRGSVPATAQSKYTSSLVQSAEVHRAQNKFGVWVSGWVTVFLQTIARDWEGPRTSNLTQRWHLVRGWCANLDFWKKKFFF